MFRKRLIGFSLVIFTSLPAASPAGERPPLRPAPFGKSSATWAGPQFLQVDAKGNVFVLRSETLDVYRVKADGTLGDPVRLRGGRPASDVTAALMSASGDRWLIAAGGEAVLYEKGKAREIPSPGWLVTSGVFVGEDPLVSVVPIRAAPGVGGPRKKLEALPVVLELDGDREWVPHIERPFVKRKTEGPARDPMDEMFANFSATLIADGRKLWAFWPFTYTVKRYTPAGREDLEIVLGEGTPKHSDDPGLQEKFQEKVEGAGYDMTQTQAGAFTARRLIQGGALGRDGRLYLVVSPAAGNGSPALDRFDPVTGLLERVPLQVATSGTLHVAAGRDGLYLATSTGTGGRWRLDWETLEKAAWKKEKGFKLNGAEVEISEAAPGKKE